MKAYCPNCGTENEGSPGSRVTCRACTASFEAQTSPAVSAPLSNFGGRIVQPLGTPASSPAPATDVPPSLVQSPEPPPPWNSSPPSSPVSRSHETSTNTLAIVSLVSGLACCVPFANLAAIITGAIALNQIGTTNEKGKEMAIGGIVLGALACFGSAIWLVMTLLAGAQ